MTDPRWPDRIKGEERTGPLLSLDEEHAPMRRRLMEAAEALYVSGEGNRNPEVGDLVVVVDVLLPFGQPHEDWWRGFGVLIHRDLDAFYIQYGNDPSDVVRWVNASCFGVPT